MKHVWRVNIKFNGTLIASQLFKSENSAQSYADQYRESDFLYRVAVEKVEVHD